MLQLFAELIALLAGIAFVVVLAWPAQPRKRRRSHALRIPCGAKLVIGHGDLRVITSARIDSVSLNKNGKIAPLLVFGQGDFKIVKESIDK